MKIGNDVSYHQGEIDFEKMKSAGSKFVYIRLGKGYKEDIQFKINKENAKKAGIPWGTYWVPVPTSMTGALIDNYLKMIDGDWGDLPPAIDIETDGLGLGMFKEWIDRVTIEWGKYCGENAPLIRKKPVLYTRATHFDLYQDTKDLKKYIANTTSLWVAHYTYNPNNLPDLPTNWKSYLIHQYSADENKLGAAYGASSVAIDMDYFNGSEDDFNSWIGKADNAQEENNGNESENEVPDEPEDEVSLERVVVTADWLRFRSSPDYISGVKTLVVEKGQVLEVIGDNIVDSSTGITWIPVRIPYEYKNKDGSEQCTMGYISSKYVSSV